MEKVIIFGTGGLSEKVLLQIDKTKCEVVEFWDNNRKKWGAEFAGIKIAKPHEVCEEVDKIVIASSFYDEIYDQLTKELKIDPDKIANYLWFDKVELLEYYNRSSTKIDDVEVKVDYDVEAKLFYVHHNEKKMYMKRSLDTERKVRDYYISLLVEQDKNSPHCYGEFLQNEKYGILIDAGCAEGNFVLDNIEKTERIIVIENDEEWLEALKYTLGVCGEKVTVVNKYLSDYDNDDNITLNEIFVKYNINQKEKCLIKLDIEGAEEKAIIGAEEMIEKMEDITIISCTYHKKNSEKIQRALFETMGMETECSRGYMFFPAEYERKIVTDIGNEKREPSLRRGLLFAKKRPCKKDDIIDCYTKDFKMNYYSYNMMGQMLEKANIKRRIELAKVGNVYIYGGGYLGIQLYHAIKDLTNVKAIVDKSGGICIEDDDIPAISFEKMKSCYDGEKIIVTPMRYYSEIQKELMQFSVEERNILYLGEFLEGGL